MKKRRTFAKKRLNHLKKEMGSIERIINDENAFYIAFENGMVLQLHDDEVTHQAIEHLESHIESIINQ